MDIILFIERNKIVMLICWYEYMKPRFLKRGSLLKQSHTPVPPITPHPKITSVFYKISYRQFGKLLYVNICADIVEDKAHSHKTKASSWKHDKEKHIMTEAK